MQVFICQAMPSTEPASDDSRIGKALTDERDSACCWETGPKCYEYIVDTDRVFTLGFRLLMQSESGRSLESPA